jgi:SAM-dependent methyltransferase
MNDHKLLQDSNARAATLKNSRVLELLCSRTEDGEKLLHLEGDELLGFDWQVPVINGIPDFVRHAPKTKKMIEIEIPMQAVPSPEILTIPPRRTPQPWFQEAGFKFPLLQAHEKGFLLDVGAGQGNRRTFEMLGYHYVSLDVSFNSGQSHQGDADIDVVADCHRLPLRSSIVEAVNCTAVLEHLYYPPLAVREICRILKPGGLLVGSCSFLEAEHFESQHHYSYLGLFRLLECSGLKTIRLFPGQSLWEAHAGSIFIGMPAKELLGRLHRNIYLWLVKWLGGETAEQRLFRHAAILYFAAVKPAPVDSQS